MPSPSNLLHMSAGMFASVLASRSSVFDETLPDTPVLHDASDFITDFIRVESPETAQRTDKVDLMVRDRVTFTLFAIALVLSLCVPNHVSLFKSENVALPHFQVKWRRIRRHGVLQNEALVKWRGFGSLSNTWEPESNIPVHTRTHIRIHARMETH